jgi:hypothetical protein
MLSLMPIGVLRIHKKAKDGVVLEPSEPIYGGYANGRGQISLFGETIVYRINFKLGTIQERPPLNSGARARYDATGLGETFQYGNVIFRRLSSAEIIEICSSGSFRVTPKLAA